MSTYIHTQIVSNPFLIPYMVVNFTLENRKSQYLEPFSDGSKQF